MCDEWAGSSSGHVSGLPWDGTATGTGDLAPRVARLLASKEIATAVYKEVYEDHWHPQDNPQGKINLCTAENNICEDLLDEKFADPDFWHCPHGMLYHYPSPGGYEATKQVVLAYVKKFICAPGDPPLDAENLLIVPGCNAAYDMLAYCLFSAGDVVLCPAPFYGRLFDNCEERAHVQIRAVPFEDDLDPHLDVQRFQEVFDDARAKGENVRAISLINPHNPLGVVFDDRELLALCQWAVRNNLFVLADEVFACSIDPLTVPGSGSFRSLLTLRHRLGNQKDKVIWMWGPSKDLCLPGLRFATVHTEIPDLQKALRRLEIMQPCAPVVQHLVTKLLSDIEWLEKFNNEKNDRLRTNRQLAIEKAKELGLPYVAPCAGLFVFVNFTEYLDEDSFEAEHRMWKRFSRAGVYLNPGHFMCSSTPGWFRIVISGHKSALGEGLSRIERVLETLERRQPALPLEDHAKLEESTPPPTPSDEPKESARSESSQDFNLITSLMTSSVLLTPRASELQPDDELLRSIFYKESGGSRRDSDGLLDAVFGSHKPYVFDVDASTEHDSRPEERRTSSVDVSSHATTTTTRPTEIGELNLPLQFEPSQQEAQEPHVEVHQEWRIPTELSPIAEESDDLLAKVFEGVPTHDVTEHREHADEQPATNEHHAVVRPVQPYEEVADDLAAELAVRDEALWEDTHAATDVEVSRTYERVEISEEWLSQIISSKDDANANGSSRQRNVRDEEQLPKEKSRFVVVTLSKAIELSPPDSDEDEMKTLAAHTENHPTADSVDYSLYGRDPTSAGTTTPDARPTQSNEKADQHYEFGEFLDETVVNTEDDLLATVFSAFSSTPQRIDEDDVEMLQINTSTNIEPILRTQNKAPSPNRVRWADEETKTPPPSEESASEEEGSYTLPKDDDNHAMETMVERNEKAATAAREDVRRYTALYDLSFVEDIVYRRQREGITSTETSEKDVEMHAESAPADESVTTTRTTVGISMQAQQPSENASTTVIVSNTFSERADLLLSEALLKDVFAVVDNHTRMFERHVAEELRATPRIEGAGHRTSSVDAIVGPLSPQEELPSEQFSPILAQPFSQNKASMEPSKERDILVEAVFTRIDQQRQSDTVNYPQARTEKGELNVISPHINKTNRHEDVPKTAFVPIILHEAPQHEVQEEWNVDDDRLLEAVFGRADQHKHAEIPEGITDVQEKSADERVEETSNLCGTLNKAYELPKSSFAADVPDVKRDDVLPDAFLEAVFARADQQPKVHARQEEVQPVQKEGILIEPLGEEHLDTIERTNELPKTEFTVSMDTTKRSQTIQEQPIYDLPDSLLEAVFGNVDEQQSPLIRHGAKQLAEADDTTSSLPYRAPLDTLGRTSELPKTHLAITPAKVEEPPPSLKAQSSFDTPDDSLLEVVFAKLDRKPTIPSGEQEITREVQKAESDDEDLSYAAFAAVPLRRDVDKMHEPLNIVPSGREKLSELAEKRQKRLRIVETLVANGHDNNFVANPAVLQPEPDNGGIKHAAEEEMDHAAAVSIDHAIDQIFHDALGAPGNERQRLESVQTPSCYGSVAESDYLQYSPGSRKSETDDYVPYYDGALSNGTTHPQEDRVVYRAVVDSSNVFDPQSFTLPSLSWTSPNTIDSMPEQEDLRHLNDSGIGMDLPAGAISIDFAFKVPKEALEQSYRAEEAAGQTNIWVDEAGHDNPEESSHKSSLHFHVYEVEDPEHRRPLYTDEELKALLAQPLPEIIIPSRTEEPARPQRTVTFREDALTPRQLRKMMEEERPSPRPIYTEDEIRALLNESAQSEIYSAAEEEELQFGQSFSSHESMPTIFEYGMEGGSASALRTQAGERHPSDPSGVVADYNARLPYPEPSHSGNAKLVSPVPAEPAPSSQAKQPTARFSKQDDDTVDLEVIIRSRGTSPVSVPQKSTEMESAAEGSPSRKGSMIPVRTEHHEKTESRRRLSRQDLYSGEESSTSGPLSVLRSYNQDVQRRKKRGRSSASREKHVTTHERASPSYPQAQGAEGSSEEEIFPDVTLTTSDYGMQPIGFESSGSLSPTARYRQVHHELYMSRKSVTSPTQATRHDLSPSQPMSPKRLVVEHTNITQITYDKPTYSGTVTEVPVNEDDADVRTTTSTRVSGFTTADLLNSLVMDGRRENRNASAQRYAEYRQRRSSSMGSGSEKKHASYYYVHRLRPEEEALEKYQDRHDVSTAATSDERYRDSASQTAEPVDVCCRLRLVKKATKNKPSQPTNSTSIRVGDAAPKDGHYEFLACRNPRHCAQNDHCDPRRLYTVKRSTMPPYASASIDRATTAQSRRTKSAGYDADESSRFTSSSGADMGDSDLLVSSHSTTHAGCIDRVSVRHTPGSSWIVSSVCKTTPFGYERSALRSQNYRPIQPEPEVIRTAFPRKAADP